VLSLLEMSYVETSRSERQDASTSSFRFTSETLDIIY